MPDEDPEVVPVASRRRRLSQLEAIQTWLDKCEETLIMESSDA